MFRLIKGNDIWDFPTLTSLSGISQAVRSKTESLAYSHGAAETGDGKFDKRTIELEVYIFGASKDDHSRRLDEMLGKISRRDQKLFLRPDRYMNLKQLDKHKLEYFPGFVGERSKNTISFVCTDPFSYDVNSVQAVKSMTTTPQTFIVHNSGNVDVEPLLTITAVGSATNVTMNNNTDDQGFRYTDANMIAGVSVVIDSKTGTVYRGEANALRNYTGSFIKLLPGDNSFTYTGAAATLKFEFVRRWL